MVGDGKVDRSSSVLLLVGRLTLTVFRLVMVFFPVPIYTRRLSVLESQIWMEEWKIAANYP